LVTDTAYLFPLAELHDFVTTELGGGMETATRLLAGSSPSEYRDSMISLANRLSPQARAAILSGGGDVMPRLATADPGFAEAYRDHLRIHGYRILGFDLTGKVLLEDPHAELVRAASQPPVDDPTPEAEQLAAELRSSLDSARSQRFDDLVAEARSTYPIREEGEAVHARVMGAVRLTALEVGRRMVGAGHLTDQEHVVYLTLDEAMDWLNTPNDISELVAERRGKHLWPTSQSPEAFLGGKPALPDPSIFPPNVGRIMRVFAHDATPAELRNGADGVAASPGIHSGPVRIVFGPEDFGRVGVGDVLVAPITTSPWEVLFPHIGALVTEGGGLLSHPAIVAREYRLPAVVGFEGATALFHDGQLVTVDGTAGTVRPREGP
jgi:pyruvate,water dikinase